MIGLLADDDTPRTAAEVADRLSLSRSTVAAILTALHARGWVQRRADLTYRLGPALVGIGDSARDSLTPPGLTDALAALADRVGCGAALGLVTETDLTFVAINGGHGRLPAGITTGTRLPLRAPAGATAVAFAGRQRQRAWLATAPTNQQTELAALLDTITLTGVGVWGIGAGDSRTLDLLTEVSEHLAETPSTDQGLRERVISLLADIAGRPYSAGDLDRDTALPLSYLVAPVFDTGRRPTWELHIGPLRAEVTRHEREHYIRELIHAARSLDMNEARY